MAERRPLVIVNGVRQELPMDDTLPGGGVSLATNSPSPLADTAAVGISLAAAREDHVHELPAILPSPDNTSAVLESSNAGSISGTYGGLARFSFKAGGVDYYANSSIPYSFRFRDSTGAGFHGIRGPVTAPAGVNPFWELPSTLGSVGQAVTVLSVTGTEYKLGYDTFAKVNNAIPLLSSVNGVAGVAATATRSDHSHPHPTQILSPDRASASVLALDSIAVAFSFSGNQRVHIKRTESVYFSESGATHTIKLFDADDSNFVGIRAPTTAQTANYIIVLPGDVPVANELLRVASVSGSNVNLEYASLPRVWAGQATVAGATGSWSVAVPAGVFTANPFATASIRAAAGATAVNLGGSTVSSATTTTITGQAFRGRQQTIVLGGSAEGLSYAPAGTVVNVIAVQYP